MTDILDIGASRLDPDTNEIKIQAKSAPIGNDPDDAPGFDDIPMIGQLGVSARPWPRTEEGAAQCVVDTDLPGTNGWATCARDQRKSAAAVVEQLGEGETAVHSTGPGFDSRTFHKDQLWAAMVGDDCAIVIDREDKKITISGFGFHWEISEQNGACMFDDTGAGIQIKGGVICLTGQIVLGGRTPIGPVAWSLTPVVGAAPGTTTTPAAGVFIGV